MAPRLHAGLRKQGASYHQAEDILQDVAERIAAKQTPFVDAADLTRFARHVARCLWIDQQRANTRRATTSCADVDAAARDFADDVVESLTARRAWELLHPNDREALFAPSDQPKTSKTYDATYHARRRLLTILATLQSWLLWLFRRVRRSEPRPRAVAVVVGAVVFTLTAATESRGVARPGAGGSDQNRRVAVRSADPTPDGRGSTPLSSREAPESSRFRERVTLPTRRVVIGPGDDGFANAGTEPTRQGDPMLCLNEDIVIGTRCVGEAEDPLDSLLP